MRLPCAGWLARQAVCRWCRHRHVLLHGGHSVGLCVGVGVEAGLDTATIAAAAASSRRRRLGAVPRARGAKEHSRLARAALDVHGTQRRYEHERLERHKAKGRAVHLGPLHAEREAVAR